MAHFAELDSNNIVKEWSLLATMLQQQLDL